MLFLSASPLPGNEKSAKHFLVKKEFKNVVDAVVNAIDEAGALISVRSVQVRM